MGSALLRGTVPSQPGADPTADRSSHGAEQGSGWGTQGQKERLCKSTALNPQDSKQPLNHPKERNAP